MKHSVEKHSRLYGLLNRKQMMEQRHQLFLAFSKDRTDNSRELVNEEVDELIRYLETYSLGGRQSGYKTKFEKGDKMRKRILSLCYEYGWTYYNDFKQKHCVDFRRLDQWMLKYSYLKKKLNQYTYEELPKLVTQFENVIKSYYKAI